MASCKVFIKCNNTRLCTKQNLLLVCDKYSVKITKVVPAGSDFNVFSNAVGEIEKFFGDEMNSSLTTSGFSPVLPAEIKASRSVIIHRVDPDIFDESTENIKLEVLRCNDWCKIDEIFKFRKSLKIVFSSSSIANRCIAVGLSMFYLHIPSRDISKDKFVKLETCLSCYGFEDHFSTHCPKKLLDPSYKICSKCSVEGHDFKSCNVPPDQFRCINCNGNHHAMAMACPKRRDAIRKKRSSDYLSSKKVSDAVKSTIIPTTTPFQHDTVYKSMALIFLASLKNVDTPGSFSKELNELYRKNNIPCLNLDGFAPPSLGSLQRFQSAAGAGSSTFTEAGPAHIIPVSGPSSALPGPPLTTMDDRPNELDPAPGRRTYKPPGLDRDSSLSSDLGGGDSTDQDVDIWSGFKFVKTWGTKLTSTDDVLKAWESGQVMITHEDGNAPNYTKVKKLLSKGVLPKVLSMKKNEFNHMASSPSRFSKR